MPAPISRIRRAMVLGGVALALQPGARAAEGPNALAPWQPAKPPRLQVVDLETEQPRTLADFAGHALIVNFWASWCAPCRTELPSLNAAADRFASRGLRLLAVNHGEMPERARRFLNEVPIHGTVLLDRSLSQLPAWGGQGLPASFVLDRRGRPRFMAFGELDWLSPQTLAALESALAV